MKYFVFIFWFISLKTYSQTIKIVDIKSNQPIPYATVIIDTNGYYTSAKGDLNLKDDDFDSLIVRHLNYKDLTLSSINLSDTVFLKPKTEILKEVLIMSFNDYKQKKIKPKNNLGFLVPSRNSEIISCINFKNKYKKAYIDKISYEIGNRMFYNLLDSISKNDFYLLRLNIYKSNSELYPQRSIRKSIIKKVLIRKIFRSQNNKNLKHGNIDFELKDLQIEIAKNDICLSLELINTNIQEKNFEKHIKFQPVLSTKKNRQIKVETYFKNVFNTRKDLKTYFEYLPGYKDFFNNKEPKLIPSIDIYYKK